MAANFWTSSHYKTLHEEEKIGRVLPADAERGLTEEDFKVVKIAMSQYIKYLAQQVKVRHRVVATAISYFRRTYTRQVLSHTFPKVLALELHCFRSISQPACRLSQLHVYLRKSFTEFDPCLVAPTCLYLASKAEESTVPAKHFIFYMKKTFQDDRGAYEVKDILEMEMKLLEALDYYLVVYHPYRPLVRFLQDAGWTDLVADSWSLVNDTYKTDLVLLYPPHMIALSCIFLACILKERDTIAWFEELRIDLNAMKNICMTILEFYENYQQVDLLDERVLLGLSKVRQRS